MKIDNKNKRQIFEIIVFAGIVLWAVFNYALFFQILGYVFKLTTPIIVGIAIAFIINVPMRAIETKIFKIHKRKHKKLIRIIALIISITLILGILGLILFLLIPELIEAFISLVKTMPDNIKWVNSLINKIDKWYPDLGNYIGNIEPKAILESSIGNANQIISNIVVFLQSTVSKLVTTFFGFIVALYILIDKENLVRQGKKVVTAFLSEKKAQTFSRVIKLTNETFSNFLSGQCIDAVLTGFEFFIVLSLVKIPYALILGVLFTVTALIPYIGAFVTLVVGAILTSVINPIYTLWYVIIFFTVQQFDDNFTYPKIVGGKVGLPALWTLVAVLIGGAISGFVGMIISIPVASVLYTLLREYINKRIDKKEKKEVKES